MSLLKSLESARGFQICISGIRPVKYKELKLDHIHKNALQQIASVKLTDGWLIMTFNEFGLNLDFTAPSLSLRGLATLSSGEDMKRFGVYTVDGCNVEFMRNLNYLENELKLEPYFTPDTPTQIIKSTFKPNEPPQIIKSAFKPRM